MTNTQTGKLPALEIPSLDRSAPIVRASLWAAFMTPARQSDVQKRLNEYLVADPEDKNSAVYADSDHAPDAVRHILEIMEQRDMLRPAVNCSHDAVIAEDGQIKCTFCGEPRV